MELKSVIDQFYYDMTLHELFMMNASKNFPNITYNSLLYLDIIAYTKDCTVTYIAEAMNVAKSAVTIKVNELIKLGLVEKKQSEQDKRINYLTVLPNVISEYKIYDDDVFEAIQKIESAYSEKEIATFCEIVQEYARCYTRRSRILNET